MRRLSIGTAILAAGLAAAYLGLGVLVRPLPAHPFWSEPAPRVIAHRGGRGLWPENTLYAFERAAALGADVLEMDLRRSVDGELEVVHDQTVDRTTEGEGAVAALSVGQLKRLDAGYGWTPDGGKTYPYRGKGIVIPTLREVFRALPQARFNLEIKAGHPGIARQLCGLVRAHGLDRRVAVASAAQGPMDEFRSACPQVATAATKDEVMRFVQLSTLFLGALFEPHAQAFQVPERLGTYAVLTRGFASAARKRNLKLEVWTVNDVQDMRRLLALPVDGIITDYPDRLLQLLGRLKRRREAYPPAPSLEKNA
jgi:glycerophosphoryl diester phosphodiesterase